MTKTLKIGIASFEDMKARTLRIARGEFRPRPTDPKVWFPSLESLAKVLSESNRELLAIIEERKPRSLQELSNFSGRATSNLSRTLKTMRTYGIVELEDLISLKLDSWANSPSKRLRDKADVTELILRQKLPRGLPVASAVSPHYLELWDALKAEA